MPQREVEKWSDVISSCVITISQTLGGQSLINNYICSLPMPTERLTITSNSTCPKADSYPHASAASPLFCTPMPCVPVGFSRLRFSFCNFMVERITNRHCIRSRISSVLYRVDQQFSTHVPQELLNHAIPI